MSSCCVSPYQLGHTSLLTRFLTDYLSLLFVINAACLLFPVFIYFLLML